MQRARRRPRCRIHCTANTAARITAITRTRYQSDPLGAGTVRSRIRPCFYCTAGRTPAPRSNSWSTHSNPIGRWWRSTGAALGTANGLCRGIGILTILRISMPCSSSSRRARRPVSSGTVWAATLPASMPACGRTGCVAWSAWKASAYLASCPRTRSRNCSGGWTRSNPSPDPKHYDSIERLTLVIRGRYPRFTDAQARFVAEAWSRPDSGQVRLLGDPRHRWMNPVRFKREDAEACWRHITAPMLMLLGEESEHLAKTGRGRGRRRVSERDSSHSTGACRGCRTSAAYRTGRSSCTADREFFDEPLKAGRSRCCEKRANDRMAYVTNTRRAEAVPTRHAALHAGRIGSRRSQYTRQAEPKQSHSPGST